jgi:hypothetical protein
MDTHRVNDCGVRVHDTDVTPYVPIRTRFDLLAYFGGHPVRVKRSQRERQVRIVRKRK